MQQKISSSTYFVNDKKAAASRNSVTSGTITDIDQLKSFLPYTVL